MREPITATVVFPDAEIDRIFNGEHVGVFIAGALRLVVEADHFARDGFHIEEAYIVPTPKDDDGEFVGPDHWLRHGIGRYCRHPKIVAEIHAELEKARNEQREAA